jgi:diketogulonate reductase-like aldo/keto reductase
MNRTVPHGCTSSTKCFKAMRAQVVFRFAQAVGILPLTGTSNAEHIKQDLARRDLALSRPSNRWADGALRQFSPSR